MLWMTHSHRLIAKTSWFNSWKLLAKAVACKYTVTRGFIGAENKGISNRPTLGKGSNKITQLHTFHRHHCMLHTNAQSLKVPKRANQNQQSTPLTYPHQQRGLTNQRVELPHPWRHLQSLYSTPKLPVLSSRTTRPGPSPKFDIIHAMATSPYVGKMPLFCHLLQKP